MTFTQIEYFLEVARCRNFTKAAKNLYVSQQTVSKQVIALENEIGVKLLDRNSRDVSLTEAGKLLYSTWEKLLIETDLSLSKAIKLNPLDKNEIRIGINEVPSIIDYVMPKLVTCRQTFKDVTFNYELGSAVYLQRRLDKNKIDLLVTFSSEVDNNDTLNYKVLNTMQIDLAIILAKNHPLANHDKLELKDIKNESIFILKDSYSKDAGQKILSHFKEEGFTPNSIRRFDNINSMEIALNMGEGVTVSYDALFRNKNGRLKFFPTQGHKGYKKADLAIAWRNSQVEKYTSKFMKNS